MRYLTAKGGRSPNKCLGPLTLNLDRVTLPFLNFPSTFLVPVLSLLDFIGIGM